MGIGRPTKYKKEYCEQAYKLCLLGATDKELSDFFEIDEKTLNNWKHDYPEFLQSLKDGKVNADAKVAKSLYHRAIGFEHPDTEFATFQGKITDQKEYMKHYPPDTVAAIFWLKNRQSAKWRDKQEIEQSGDSTVHIKLEGDLKDWAK